MSTRLRIVASWLGALGFSTFIALPAYSQITPITPIIRGNTSPSGTLLNQPTIRINPATPNQYGTSSSYPYGSQLNELGWISTPGGRMIYPSVGTNNGDGSTTYYYPNGARITIDKTKLPASGAVLR